MSVIHLTSDNFKEEVLESKVPVLVDFWATWCGPCQMVGPIVEELGEEVTDAKICKVDVDENPDLAREYRVMSIPTFLVFKDGQMVKRDMGAKPKEELLALLK
ncbi:MAG: thioredoxin [Lachnospiraceae bacterium]|nr:thioredoxin [Lachnospiraceae bacterium]